MRNQREGLLFAQIDWRCDTIGGACRFLHEAAPPSPCLLLWKPMLAQFFLSNICVCFLRACLFCHVVPRRSHIIYIGIIAVDVNFLNIHCRMMYGKNRVTAHSPVRAAPLSLSYHAQCSDGIGSNLNHKVLFALCQDVVCVQCVRRLTALSEMFNIDTRFAPRCSCWTNAGPIKQLHRHSDSLLRWTVSWNLHYVTKARFKCQRAFVWRNCLFVLVHYQVDAIVYAHSLFQEFNAYMILQKEGFTSCTVLLTWTGVLV